VKICSNDESCLSIEASRTLRLQEERSTTRHEKEDANGIAAEVYIGLNGWLELLNAMYELGYLWDVKDRLIEELEMQETE